MTRVNRAYKSELFEVIHETASDLFDAAMIGQNFDKFRKLNKLRLHMIS